GGRKKLEESVFLHGVALANYRGIGKEPVYVGPFSRFNFFIGSNNSGKSGVLNFIAKHLKPLVIEATPYGHAAQKPQDLESLDIHVGATRHQVKMGVGVPTKLVIEKITASNEQIRKNPLLHKSLKLIVEAIAKNDLIWVAKSQDRRASIRFEG